MMEALYRSHWIPQELRAKLRPVKQAVKFLLRPITPKLAERAENPYTTHIPVLIALSRLLKVRKVLELGCGEHSTLTFLDRAIFSELEAIDSLENDHAWMEKIVLLTQDDPRIDLKLVRGRMSDSVRNVDIQSYDLVFIDDSISGEERADTIREIVMKMGDSQIAVIHDYENQPYRKAAKGASNRFRFDALNPNTGIIWNNAAINQQQLRRLNAQIKSNRKHVAPDDSKKWVQIFDNEI